jgi:NSS family neurotransmitter:Na+ symporter
MDIVSIYICPLGALLAGVMFFWVAGRKFVHAAVDEGREKAIGPWFYPLSKYVYCAAALTALIAGALMGGIG